MNNSSVNQEPASPNNPEKPDKKADTLFISVSVGITLLVCVAITGFALRGRISNLKNSVNPAVSIPTTSINVTLESKPSYSSVFEPGACNFKVPDQANVTCGFVIVPEDRSGDVKDTIKLAVAIYHSTNNPPKADPILYLQGGPGGTAIDWSVDVYQSVIMPLIVDRDFVVLDPRGVGYSKPSLDCNEIKNTYLSDIQGRITSDQRASYYEGALLACKNAFANSGANPSAYTSVEMAADARDTLVALGYQQANLYGISYGTRIAQFLMRDYPEVVHTAILDSVVPIETKLLDQEITVQDQVLQALFKDCKAEPACSAAYPDLEAVYGDVISQLNTQPVKIHSIVDQNRALDMTVDGPAFRNVLIWMLRDSQTITVIPQMIYQTYNGDLALLTLANALPIYTLDTISMGSYISVNCHDQVFAMSAEKLDKTIYDLCQLWQVKQPLQGENDPVNSEIPTLIFAGKYDSVTPVSFADQLAGHLGHSQLVVIPNQGHAPSSSGTSDCPTKLILTFLSDPNAPLDLTCVTETGATGFVVPADPKIPLAFESTTIAQYQITTRIPAKWTAADFGFYNRNGAYGDITQVGIQRAAVSESQWATWLSTNFRGNQGLDQVPVKYGERQANGLKWSIYRSEAHGFPVEIAFAKSNNDTLMVLMISNKDEHDALYDLVFLTVIDSTRSSK